mmetsp:Transcript_2034/g.7359  ORF Transcript_2034/g.7359 Transcript_2034/m.7359 type:complete len:180 (+) Transcript_2034:84-623(+)|eukprot:CAMPEP_0114616346 /NCGR_PEP_ID=MMETSP0168-20121206/6639_1 /TAXON_ID=95228 ORGANISM="Vannella sp., Strain DIVA3 517/6/12" /NCGR_SAMPLE_ID=MMETSP0168 /ASSEMBLY_ACC=CAM_ASM_000044 /LENGTH=179 /DNA_ID=CAMNT_0001827457 /DNA_START=72 /DNA_END=611 /DNA_ORIENTATION=-
MARLAHGLVLLVLFATIAECHLCLFWPPQRGELDGYNKVEADDCGLQTGPCGGRATGPIEGHTMAVGANNTITFQKNQNHYNATEPGNFSFAIAYRSNPQQQHDFIDLGSIPDTDTPALTMYTVPVELPNPILRHAVLQVAYNTNNSPGTFYQCADINLRGFPCGCDPNLVDDEGDYYL